MFLDLLLGILLVLAIFKGYRRGLIVGIFSFVALIVGLAAAIKLSVVVADYLGKSVNISGAWLPVISFLIVFIIVVILVRLGANAIEKTVEFAMLGWVNKLGGILFYAAIYITIFSVLVFYASQVHLVKPETISQSVSYPYIQPWGPKAINTFGSIIPWFADMFNQLEQFFGHVAENTKA